MAEVSPYKRAQILLQDMAGLTLRLLEIAGNKPWQGAHHTSSSGISSNKSMYPPFLAAATVPPEGAAASSTKEVLSILAAHQSQLSDAVSEIAELQSLEQEKQRIAEAVAAKDAAIRDFARRVRDAEQVLELTLDEFDQYRRSNPVSGVDFDGADLGLGTVDVGELISYAHRISYTTFAPPEYLLGQPGALAPAPQEQQMRASQLYHFSDMDLGMLKPPPAPSPPPVVQVEVQKEPVVLLPIGLPPGIKLPPMPAGWKPGDPVPLPEQAVPPAAQAPGVIHVPFVQLDLNPELEDDYASEYSDDDESSGDD